MARGILIILAVVYFGIAVYAYFGNGIGAFFADPADSIRAEVERDRVQVDKLKVEKGHEKDMALIQNQHDREMSAAGYQRFLNCAVIFALLGACIWLMHRRELQTDWMMREWGKLQESANKRDLLQVHKIDYEYLEYKAEKEASWKNI